MSATRCPAGLTGRVGDAVAGLVFDQLARLQRVAAGEPLPPAEVARIREDMREGLAIWRTLLAAHRPSDDTNGCPQCPRTWWLRRVRWPCHVWQTAYAYLITDPCERAATGPHSRRRTGLSHSGPGSTPPPPAGLARIHRSDTRGPGRGHPPFPDPSSEVPDGSSSQPIRSSWQRRPSPVRADIARAYRRPHGPPG